MNKFKFLTEELFIHSLFGKDLGYVANLRQLNNVMIITKHIMQLRNYQEPADQYELDILLIIFPLMFRLFRDKNYPYGYQYVVDKIRAIETCIESDEIKRFVSNTLAEAFTTVDVEAEMVQYIYNKLNWVE